MIIWNFTYRRPFEYRTPEKFWKAYRPRATTRGEFSKLSSQAKIWHASSTNYDELPKKISAKSVERFGFDSRFKIFLTEMLGLKLAIFRF